MHLGHSCGSIPDRKQDIVAVLSTSDSHDLRAEQNVAGNQFPLQLGRKRRSRLRMPRFKKLSGRIDPPSP
jgi:hypothetical protein